MSRKWINPTIGLLAGLVTYMVVSGDQLGIVGLMTFTGTFVVVWVGLRFLTSKMEQGRTGEGFPADDPAYPSLGCGRNVAVESRRYRLTIEPYLV